MLTTQQLWIANRAKEGQDRLTCPWCSPHRKKKTDTCLSVFREGDIIKYQCHHGDCAAHGLIRLGEQKGVLKLVANVNQPEIQKKQKEDFDGIDDRHFDWLSSRGISAATALAYDLIGEEVQGQAVVGFPYFDKDGSIVAVKKRFTNDKRFLCWQSPRSFFGLRQIKKGDDLVIVEGEMDVLAMAEAGIYAVSVPNGASLKLTEGKVDPAEDTKFQFLWAAKDYIEAAQKIIIATDNDGPGNAMAEEIARRVGKAKCWRIEFPPGTKDSNDVLLKLGKDGLRKIAKEAAPWPVEGLYAAEKFRDEVWELYDKGIGRGESTGYESVDELYTIVPGQVTVVTGIPSSGKSEFIDQVMVNLAENRSWKFGICSFENEPRLHIAKLMAKRARKPFFVGPTKRMDNEESKAAFNFVQEHFAFLWQDNGGLSDLDSILDRLRVAILRYGIRGCIIDPYNFISRNRGETSETEWISDMLTKIKAFAMGHGIHIWFVAHPTKMQRGADGKIPPPGGFDISGSAAWFAKADCGLTVHREKDDPYVSQIHLWKCRFSWVGKQGSTNLVYDTATTRYSECEYQPSEEFEL